MRYVVRIIGIRDDLRKIFILDSSHGERQEDGMAKVTVSILEKGAIANRGILSTECAQMRYRNTDIQPSEPSLPIP
jgi:hypothetical protein